MRLWIDGQCLQTTSRLRGIGRYMTELIRAIAQTCPNVELSISFNAVMADAAIAARALVAPWIAPANIHVWQGAAAGAEYRSGYTHARRLGEIALAHHIACLGPDMALSASPFEGQGDPASPFLTAAGHDIPRAAIFYDAIPYRYPARYLRNPGIAASYKRRLAAHRGFEHVLAISDFARDEARTLWPQAEVVRIDAGVSPDFIGLTGQAIDAALLKRLGIHKPFLLYVGALDWRKNVLTAVEAFALLPPPLRETLQFVLAGKSEVSDLEKARAGWRRKGLPENNLIALDHVADPVLVQLYKQADLVIQPSLLEGFGLTALEAMHCGVPVIASNTGALPEVVGDARALFDPADPAAIAARITEILSDPLLARALVDRGAERARQFSWERTALLAVEALQGWARPRPQQSRDAIRRITRQALGARPRAPKRTARILAAAEPRTPHAPRLLIDVTATSYNDPGTGIQRVVNNIARALLARSGSSLFWCDTPAGFFQAQFGPTARLGRAAAGPEHHILPGAGDQILMLDSSWAFSPVYNLVMRRARLQGSGITSVLYDLVPLKMPAFCDARMSETFCAWIKSALFYSTGFVCISRAVADELLALLEAIRYPRPMQVGYWRLGADMRADLPRQVKMAAAPRPDSTAPMFLMVGTLEPRKGHRIALDAFTALWRNGFAGTLCIIGKRGWAVEHLAADLSAHPEWGKKLIWLEDADDRTLEAHYAACTALIAASLAEGFGLPIVEAGIHGKPVIASDIAVFREVAGDSAAVTYFRAGSPGALAAAVEDFLVRHDRAPVTRQDKIVTWAQSAAELENIVMGGPWYRTYQPRHPASDIVLDDIGDWTVPGLRTDAERQHLLELAEGPIPINNGAAFKFIVRVTNLSGTAWSSAGPDGIALGIRPERRGGKTRFSRIPLLQLPGETHTMAVELDTAEAGTARRVTIGLAQGSGDWWPSPLAVALVR
jgi:glycosyltransferase involved in cell wall biosynthesis